MLVARADDTLAVHPKKSLPQKANLVPKAKGSYGHGHFRWLKAIQHAVGKTQPSSAKDVLETERVNPRSSATSKSSPASSRPSDPSETASPPLSSPVLCALEQTQPSKCAPCVKGPAQTTATTSIICLETPELSAMCSQEDEGARAPYTAKAIIETRRREERAMGGRGEARQSTRSSMNCVQDIDSLSRDRETSQETLVRARQVRGRLMRFLGEGQSLISALEKALVDCEDELQDAEAENASWKARIVEHERAIKEAEKQLCEKQKALETERRSFQRLAAGFLHMEFEKVNLLERWEE